MRESRGCAALRPFSFCVWHAPPSSPLRSHAPCLLSRDRDAGYKFRGVRFNAPRARGTCAKPSVNERGPKVPPYIAISLVKYCNITEFCHRHEIRYTLSVAIANQAFFYKYILKVVLFDLKF